MIAIQRPGQDPLQIEFVLIDFEGTLAFDRRVHPKAKDKINLISKRATTYILSKGDKKLVDVALRRVKAEIVYLTEKETSQRKLDFLRELGAVRTVVIGNGLDDAPILDEAGLGICVISREGASAEAIIKADVVVLDVLDALDLLLKPLSQKATLGL